MGNEVIQSVQIVAWTLKVFGLAAIVTMAWLVWTYAMRKGSEDGDANTERAGSKRR